MVFFLFFETEILVRSAATYAGALNGDSFSSRPRESRRAFKRGWL
jgi:hypothetical protein